MLDINAGIPLLDESELIKAMIAAAQAAVGVPLCIDPSVIEALEAGWSVYEVRALGNSVTAEDERLEQILPLVARHDAAGQAQTTSARVRAAANNVRREPVQPRTTSAESPRSP
jgi:cobalamin-dependent methionine synthase I